LRRPGVAWPTVALAAASILGWSASMFLFSRQHITGWQAWSLSSLCAFVSFTPLHDCVHGSVAPKCRWLNEFIGFVCGVPLVMPHIFFRHIHMVHHKHTNEDTAGINGLPVDPDHWATTGPAFQLPIRWATALFWYSYWGKKDYLARKENAGRAGDTAELHRLHHFRNSCFGFWAAALAGMLALWYYGRDSAPVVCWLLPAVTAATCLSYMFSYVPHRAAGLPHAVPHKENPYLSTNVTKGIFGTVRELDILTLSQNLHNIHHLFPFVPFYRHRAIWEELESVLMKKGTRVLPLLLGDRHLKQAGSKGH